MDNLSTASTRSTPSHGTPGHVYSPLPIRTPHLLTLSAKLSIEHLGASDNAHKNTNNMEYANHGNRFIYKKLFDFAKQDLESEPR